MKQQEEFDFYIKIWKRKIKIYRYILFSLFSRLFKNMRSELVGPQLKYDKDNLLSSMRVPLSSRYYENGIYLFMLQ